MPISSIQATIAKLSIKPPLGGMEPSVSWQLSNCEPVMEPANAPAPLTLPSSLSQPEVTEPVAVLPTEQLLESTTTLVPLIDTTAANPEIANNYILEEVEQRPSRQSPATCTAPSSSSLDLLASLTPEAFNLDSSQKGKQKMNKQSFLQPQNGEGLSRGIKANDDPLSMLDPLWRLNKT
ncbi:hypothetical protein NDU88_003973 [Pleurodeles waltl]|uniref:Uncharacterized protein n=3 Tax=Pleurodeles waltl TaxID=8319 RepID=A0AAV7M508_PLEWA|nr:hypothetical protein NDU88_003973 [Pleurodeles waltl]